ncbi:alpha-(1-_3)-arabinofuranosyltransferase domain-containing protein [Nocardioides sp. SYSU DS0651]|uniref:alpha-(1->3)-arabinofuranosyltransferase domain-containing protein n=1 Tax=Nocardioides sp. SYSU DS0651 TaxID=3415955 RepID=UPI003F4BAA2C
MHDSTGQAAGQTAVRTAGRTAERRCAALLLVVYGALALLVLAEKWGQTTSDTRFELTEVPAAHLAGTFALWNPDVSLGELQNQAYGYLFPQGPFFALLDLVGSPGWLTQRLWSVLVLLVACEGARRLARALGTGPWAAAAAGLAYGLVPRHVTELGTRSAEILPGAVIPWALLPVVLAIAGRMRPRTAAVLSAAAFAFAGGVNGTATAAPAALLAIVVGWAVARRRLGWRFAVGWLALIGAVSAWWLVSLLRLGAYSPPFFDFVEDARATTSTSGFSAVLRGASNWVGYITVGGERWWPAGYDLAYEPWLVLGTGLLAVLGVVGLLRMRHPLRTPLVLAAAFGLACQVVAHTAALDGPLSQLLQDLLDGPLAPLRNVPKVDPVLRVPLVLGLGVFVDDALRAAAGAVRGGGWRDWARRGAAGGLALAVAGGLVAAAQPIATADTRTPGWEEIPGYWSEAADFLAERAEETPGGGATWVIPGSGFGIQRWGWTMEEPMEAVGRTPWVTRSQVPLVPPETIRLLSALEAFLETGAGSPYLRHMLDRIGIDTVLVRHDLEPEVSQATPASLVGVALGRSPGLQRVGTFGRLEFGPAIEVFEVEPAVGAVVGAGGYDVRDIDDTVTVGGSVEDAVAAVGSGLVGPAQPIVLAGEEGWEQEADVLGDRYRLRERAFGQIHDAESNVMTPGEPYRGGRVVPNYPGAAGAEPIVARYEGIDGLDASSSRGWADSIGIIRPENAPWSAVDGDLSTYWQPAPFRETEGQWLRVDLEEPRRVGKVTLREPLGPIGIDRVHRWRVTAGDESRTVSSDPFTGVGTVRLDVVADAVRVEVVDAPSEQAAVGLAELEIEGVDPERTLVLPEVPTDGPPDLLFSARPEVRTCVTTLLAPDCDRYRRRASEEATGIDRTFTLEHGGTWRVRGLAVARSDVATLDVLQPWSGVRIDGSSWLAQDPTVSPRMAYDADHSTSWVADPRDPEPTVTIDLGRERTLRRLAVSPPAGVAVRPDTAVIRAVTDDGVEVRRVDLGGFGAIEPLRTRELTIAFSRSSPAVGGLPLGIGELHLGGARTGVPLDGGGTTGAVCGLGPRLVVDGEEIPTRVEGRIGDVVAAGQLAVVPCGQGRRLTLDAGEHRVRLESTRQFQPVALNLVAVGRGASDDVAERSRDVRLVSADDTRVVLELTSGEASLLSSPHNVNHGWVATLDGERLEPITVDGWAQGWVVPEGASGEVQLVFAPQRGYLVALLGGLVLLGLVLLVAAGILVGAAVRRRPLATPGPDAGSPLAVPGARRRRHLRRGRAVVAGVVLVAGAAGWLVGGPVVGVATAAGVVLARWPRVLQGVVGAVLVGALVAHVALLAEEAQRAPRAIDLLTGAALGAALAAAVVRRPGRDPGPPP